MPSSRTQKSQGWRFPLAYLACRGVGEKKKTDGSGRITMDYHEFNHIMTALAAALLDAILLLEQIDTPFGS